MALDAERELTQWTAGIDVNPTFADRSGTLMSEKPELSIGEARHLRSVIIAILTVAADLRGASTKTSAGDG
jgi:hypothetical protein